AGELVDAVRVLGEAVAQTGHAGDELAGAVGAGAGAGGELVRGLGEARVLGGAVPGEGRLDPLGVGDHAPGALDEAGLLVGAVDAVGDLLDAVGRGGRALADALGGRGETRVLRGAVAVDDGVQARAGLVDAVDVAGHALDRPGHPLGLLAQRHGLRIIGIALGEIAGVRLHGAGGRIVGGAVPEGKTLHPRVLRGAVALDQARHARALLISVHDRVEAGRSLVDAVGVGDHALGGLGEAGLVLGAAEPVGRLLGALAELGHSLVHLAGGGGEARVLLR